MKTCTVCGSQRVSRAKTPLRLRGGARVYVYADHCSNCGETYFDPKAIDAIRAARDDAE